MKTPHDLLREPSDSQRTQSFSKTDGFQNPMDRKLQLKVDAAYKVIRVQLLNSQGVLIQDEELNVPSDCILDLNNFEALEKGSYVILIQTSSGDFF